MTIRNRAKLEERGIEIDCSGPNGNAFAIMGLAQRLAKELGRDDCDGIIKEMMSGDYDNLVDVMDREFGDYVTIYR